MTNVAGQIGGLLARLQSPDFFEREEAVNKLSEFAEDEAVAGLVLAIEDPDLGIRELAADRLCNIKGDVAAQLLIRFLAHEDIGTRNLASEILVKIGPAAVPALVEHIAADDHDVRKFICDVLGLIGDDQAIKALCQALWDENANVVCSATEALGEIGSPAAIKDLVAVADKIEDARLPAIEAFGKIGDPAALDYLYDHLETADPMLLCLVIEAIGKIGRPDSLNHLSVFLNNENKTVAETAMTAVIDISMKNEGRVDFDVPLSQFTGFLFEGIKNQDEAITEFTLSRLGHWFGSEVIEGLLEVIDYVDDERLKQITGILGSVGPAAARPIITKLPHASNSLKLKLLDVIRLFADVDVAPDLLPMLENDEPEIRQKVVYILGVSGYMEAVPHLKRLAADANGHVRAAVYSALGWLCTQDDVDFVARGLDDEYADVREATVGSMIIIGGTRVVAKFTADLYHEDVERQRLAVTALGWIGEQDVVEPLTKAINHPDAGVRRSAISSLARIGTATDTDPIVMALNDEDPAVRKAAVSALIALKGRRAMSDVRLLLDDADVWVRYHTITAIGGLADSEYADLIMPYLQDDMDIVKIAAAKALSQMKCREAVPVLKDLSDDKNQDLARAAELALSNIGSL